MGTHLDCKWLRYRPVTRSFALTGSCLGSWYDREVVVACGSWLSDARTSGGQHCQTAPRAELVSLALFAREDKTRARASLLTHARRMFAWSLIFVCEEGNSAVCLLGLENRLER